jgi:hypothetical protein
MFDAENEGGLRALGLSVPRQINHACLVNPGMETELTNDFVYECSRWDPYSPGELLQLTARRRDYAKREAEAKADEPTEEIDDESSDAAEE